MDRRTGNGTVGHERARRRGRRIKAYPIGELAPVRSPSVRARGAKTIPVCSLALRAGSSSLPHPIPLRTGRSCLVTDPRRIKLAGTAGCLALPPRAPIHAHPGPRRSRPAPLAVTPAPCPPAETNVRATGNRIRAVTLTVDLPRSRSHVQEVCCAHELSGRSRRAGGSGKRRGTWR